MLKALWSEDMSGYTSAVYLKSQLELGRSENRFQIQILDKMGQGVQKGCSR